MKTWPADQPHYCVEPKGREVRERKELLVKLIDWSTSPANPSSKSEGLSSKGYGTSLLVELTELLCRAEGKGGKGRKKSFLLR